MNNRLKQHGFRSIKPIPPSQVSEVQSGIYMHTATGHIFHFEVFILNENVASLRPAFFKTL